MEAAIAVFIGTMAGGGVYLLLRARTFDVVLGLALLSYAVNVLILVMGRIAIDKAPILGAAPATLAHYADPLPQALVLTAIVIGFAMTALLLAVAVAARVASGNDHVDSAVDEVAGNE